MEKGGRSVQRETQKSNLTATPGCSSDDCPACQEGRGDGGNCRKSNVQYEMECMECPETSPTVYVGETARNVYTRGLEHLSVYRQRQRGGKKESFMHQHQEDRHQGEEARFRTKVTGAYRDCLTRQISEAVHIRRSEIEVLNSKSEWHQPALFQVQHEIRRG